MPCSLCGHGWPAERIGDASGRTRPTFSEALRVLSTSPDTRIVTPCRLPENDDVHLQVGCVVPDLSQWSSGNRRVAGVENCWRWAAGNLAAVQRLGDRRPSSLRSLGEHRREPGMDFDSLRRFDALVRAVVED